MIKNVIDKADIAENLSSNNQVYIKLNSRQRLFVDKYISCFNLTESALYAGYSQRSAAQIGSELLKKPKIKAVIDDLLSIKTKNDIDITPDFIRKGIKEAILECKNPKDRFIGYELLGKATPGTFEQSPTANIQINYMDIAAKYRKDHGIADVPTAVEDRNEMIDQSADEINNADNDYIREGGNESNNTAPSVVENTNNSRRKQGYSTPPADG